MPAKSKSAAKKVTKSSHKRKRKFWGVANGGALYVVAGLGIVGLFGGMLAGGAIPQKTNLSTAKAPADPYACCDTGNGTECKPILEKQITYKGQQYALLKSNIAQTERTQHVVYTDEYTAEGQRIFTNNSNDSANYKIPGCEEGKDLIGVDRTKNSGRPCFGIPDEQIIYVCRDSSAECAKNVNNNKVPFDAYYRIADGPVAPEIASYCPKPKSKISQSGQQVIVNVTPDGKERLQLETFKVKNEQAPHDWLGAWCKPAIYLYPEQQTQVHVQVAPKGEMKLTIPQYPANGWTVTAYPDGRIVDNNISYPYLYWEAAIPDKLISEPKQGYVVAYNELEGLFNTVLPSMGLNGKETLEFSEYWLKVLPKSKYYFVGVLPEKQIDTLAPLTINPKPDSVLRVSLFFKALDKKESVVAPNLSGFERKGFTVTEWGAFFKADKNHKNFTCLM